MDMRNILLRINRSGVSYRVTTSDEKTDEWRRRQSQQLAVMPHNVETASEHLLYFRVTTLLETLTESPLEKLSQHDVKTWARAILLISTQVFNGSCGKILDNPEAAVIRVDLCASTYSFPCRRCSTNNRHTLKVHLKNHFGAEVRHSHFPLLDFSGPHRATTLLAMEQVWVGIPRLSPLVIYPCPRFSKQLAAVTEDKDHPRSSSHTWIPASCKNWSPTPSVAEDTYHARAYDKFNRRYYERKGEWNPVTDQFSTLRCHDQH
ncbi:hypothetical protein Y032_0002g1064 [Ancylostoma ceylanicum]|uniref:Uncharacterized protein n=1 Tax=Ancylostoma ceylanicum TaxID=53326 RepID=A0A016VZH0_9BILA|nr:hypothetical protein Y032_0002g1064 [Ancylostoma ceylanicum]